MAEFLGKKNAKRKNFTVIREDGTVYENERMVWPDSLGTFRYSDQVKEDVRK